MFIPEDSKEVIEKRYDPFKYYVAIQIKLIKVMDKTIKKECKELDVLRENQNKIAGIITTNYDTILETIFPDFNVMIGQDNLLASNTNNIFEIFKIHGSSEKPDSIVITDDDYKYFENKLKYLSAKLLTIFVEHPVIFLGYSARDLNIRKILKEVSECLDRTQLDKIKKNLIFITPAFGKKEEIKSKEIDFGDKQIVMTEIIIEDFSALFEALSLIKSSMPVKIMRKMQDMFCNFIATTEAKNNIIVGNIDNAGIDDEELGIYFGDLKSVSSMGFDYYSINDILEDILLNNKPYLMNNLVIEKTFKNIRSIAGNTYLPIYKYIDGLKININDLPDTWHIIRSLDDVELTTLEKKYTKNKKIYDCIEDIEKDYPNHLARQLAHVKNSLKNNTGAIQLDELKGYLIKIFEYRNGSEEQCETFNKVCSTFKRLVALYDFIKYKKV